MALRTFVGTLAILSIVSSAALRPATADERRSPYFRNVNEAQDCNSELARKLSFTGAVASDLFFAFRATRTPKFLADETIGQPVMVYGFDIGHVKFRQRVNDGVRRSISDYEVLFADASFEELESLYLRLKEEAENMPWSSLRERALPALEEQVIIAALNPQGDDLRLLNVMLKIDAQNPDAELPNLLNFRTVAEYEKVTGRVLNGNHVVYQGTNPNPRVHILVDRLLRYGRLHVARLAAESLAAGPLRSSRVE